MKSVYARAVLWLIAPALCLEAQRNYADVKRKIAAAPDSLFRMPTLFPGETIGRVESARPSERFTDDQPREGCSITVKIGTSFVIEMWAPGRELPIEVYGCRDPKAMLLVVECLASGRTVPRGYN